MLFGLVVQVHVQKVHHKSPHWPFLDFNIPLPTMIPLVLLPNKVTTIIFLFLSVLTLMHRMLVLFRHYGCILHTFLLTANLGQSKRRDLDMTELC